MSAEFVGAIGRAALGLLGSLGDLSLTGAVAQYGRGIVEDVSSQLVTRFAECLKAQLTAQPEEAGAATAAQAKPVSGLSLGLGALGRSVGRFFRRLFRRS